MVSGYAAWLRETPAPVGRGCRVARAVLRGRAADAGAVPATPRMREQCRTAEARTRPGTADASAAIGRAANAGAVPDGRERRRCYLPAAASVVELPEAAPAAVDVAVDCCWVAVVESVRA